MSKWRIHTPEGFQDTLFDECASKRGLEDKLRKLFVSCGYFEVETPTVEFFDVFSSDSGRIPQETMFKFFDQQGRILVIRPDITIPVARITATKFRDIPYPLRCSYIGNVFRYNEYGGGKQNEFTQAGVELLGVSTPESDAEVIAIAIKALKEAGLENFQVDIGQVEFFNGLMEETGLPDEDIARMRMLIDRKDYVGVGVLLERCDIREDLKKLIFDLPALFGSTDVIDRVEAMTENKRCQDALGNIRKVIRIIEDYDLGKYVSVDLGMLRDLDYDTGIIFRGFTHGIGFPVLTGGRYDRLVGEFGKECPAVGFSLGIGLILTALQRQDIDPVKLGSDVIVRYEDAGRKTAFRLCDELRRQGLVAELDVAADGLDVLRQYAAKKSVGGIINVIDEEVMEMVNLETGETTRTSFDELIRK